ncbi:MAG: PLP-dependent aminotransferase family protein [Rhodospirillales bacterium]|jgi:DNA-binding transcriptional MocR family regulator|nr:PLP-dependent aminotransferase family protein [Rhodospirillales bacterium]
MTIWTPDLNEITGPKYAAIAQAIGEAIADGQLSAGDRLPAHRDLSYRLGVTVGTVTRGYAEAERRGLVVGEVGRGTFVKSANGGSATQLFAIRHDQPPAGIDFSLNFPPEGIRADLFARTASRIASNPFDPSLFGYQPAAGNPRHRAAANELISHTGLETHVDRVVLCNGTQHGMAITMAALCQPGDVVLTEELTYPGIKAVAAMFHLRLRGVAMDHEGMLPDAFEAACQKGDAKVLYCIPTFHNPTSTVMPESRRAEIAEIARKYGIFIVEDDVYGFLEDDRPLPISGYLPEQSFYVSSTSKCMMPSLRVGFVLTPPGMTEPVSSAERAMNWMTSPITAEIMTRWIEDGTAAELVRWHRRESRARLEIAERVLKDFAFDSTPGSYHLWLPLPPPWQAEEFTEKARVRGVHVIPSAPFAVGRTAVPHALRICMGATRTREELEHGLTIIADLLVCGQTPCLDVM